MTVVQSFDEFDAEVVRLRREGQLREALDLIAQEGHRFPHQAAYTHLATMWLNIELGRSPEAIRALAEALAAGCRIPLPVLQSERFAALHDLSEFQRLSHISAMRYDAELMASRPELLVRRPAVPAAGTLLVLHGNNSRVDETAPHWEPAVALGWTVALTQSAEIAWSPRLFVWNDNTRARSQILQHLGELLDTRDASPSPMVLAGFSMGALRALEGGAALERVDAVVAVGPYIPSASAEALARALSLPSAIIVGEGDEEGRPGSETIAYGLRERGIPVLLDVVPGLGHAYPLDSEVRIGAALDFLLANDPAQ